MANATKVSGDWRQPYQQQRDAGQDQGPNRWLGFVAMAGMDLQGFRLMDSDEGQ